MIHGNQYKIQFDNLHDTKTVLIKLESKYTKEKKNTFVTH